jgi:exopolysaccharide transport family protein
MLQRLASTNVPEQTADGQGFDLREILNFLWRQWKFIGSIVGVALLVAIVSLARETPRYTASTQILLDPQKQKAAGADAVLSDVNLDFANIENQMAIIRSTTFLRRVVEKERLVSDPEFGSGPAQGPSVLETIRSYVPGSAGETKSAAAVPQNEIIPSNVMGSVGALQGAMTVARTGQGYILTVSVTSIDPARAAKLANAIADAYIVDKLDARFEAAKRASSWLSDRLVELRKQLRASEEAVAQFRTERGLSQGTNVTLNQQQLSDLNARLVTARAETADKKARFELFNSADRKAAQNVPDAVNSALVANLRQQEAAISQKLADLVARYSDNHPLVVNARAELRDIQRAIATETQRSIANMKNEYELAKAREEALERSLNQVTGQSGIDSDAAITLRELERTAAVNKSLFEDFLQRAKLTEEQSTFEAREARVITPALPPGVPSFPQKNRTMMTALAIGLLLGVGGALAKEKLNSGFTTPRQIEDMLELPLLASISRMEQRDLTVDGKTIQIPFYPAVRPLSRYSEAMRALRSGVQMTDVDNPPRVVQVTSTIPSEGKTTIAISLAVSVAASGLKVLLIDADMRHPSASKFLNLQKETGLVDLLLGQATLQQVIRYQENGKFWTLAAGSKTQNPPDLLGSERMKAHVETFRKSFDYIVIDTPPVGPVIDPVVVSHLADKVIFIVRWASTAREIVQHSIQQLGGHKKIAGVVFNYVNDGQAQKYGKYAYSYYYGSRYYKKYYTE